MPTKLASSSPSTFRCFLRPVQTSHPTSATIESTKRGIRIVTSRQSFNTLSLQALAQPHHHALINYHSPAASPTFSHIGNHGQIPKRDNDHKPPDERILKLGNTLRTLSPLLPKLLTHSLPPKILSPNVTLHLFPSTHPHLPTVKGRTFYRAALYTVPVAWGSVPIVGNVNLQILSERIVRAGTVLDPNNTYDGDCRDERLVVRWKTEPRREENNNQQSSTASALSSISAIESDIESPFEADQKANPKANHHKDKDRDTLEQETTSLSESKIGMNKRLSVLLGGDSPIFKLSNQEQFTGLFIFSFDEEGRVASHTVEHADDANGWERTPKFVTLTDWLIGKARGSLEHPGGTAGLAFHGCQESVQTSDDLALQGVVNDPYNRR